MFWTFKLSFLDFLSILGLATVLANFLEILGKFFSNLLATLAVNEIGMDFFGILSHLPMS